MSKLAISIPEAPEYEPGYSQAVKAGNTVYVGGTMGVDSLLISIAMIAVVD
jgi:2-iminobutanoate/2-iminopropanoate deaminase